MAMKVHLMYPHNRQQGKEFERLAHFAARRARTMKTHDELEREVDEASPEKRRNFLHYILEEEWSRDCAEFSFFMWDLEEIPTWLMIEFFRHRFVIRDWSPEQRSKRAIHGERIPVMNPFDVNKDPGFHYWFNELAHDTQEFMATAHEQGFPAEMTRYAALEGSETAVCLAVNARALYDVAKLRASRDTVGDGNAHPLFQELMDRMYLQARTVCPLLLPEVRH